MNLTNLSRDELIERSRIARELTSNAPPPHDVVAARSVSAAAAAAGAGPRGLPVIDWAGAGVTRLVPSAAQIDPKTWLDHLPLPKADVVVITWTSDEWDALHYVFSNALEPLTKSSNDNDKWRSKWLPYRRDFYKVFQTLWARRLISGEANLPTGAPSLNSALRRWGSFCVVNVGNLRVLLFKSDLHLNQDGEGLPLVPMTEQIIADCDPSLILSIGTSGGVDPNHVLGDTVVANSGKFRFGQEFENAAFNTQTETSSWHPSSAQLATAESLLMTVKEADVTPPTAHFGAVTIKPKPPRGSKIHLDSRPVLTTDFFEFGTTDNGLQNQGCCVEMDDAVIGMVCNKNPSGKKIPFGFLRNVSDPVITGEVSEPDFPRNLQVAWAVVTYQGKGLYTSFNGALATWAMIAGQPGT